MRIRAERAGVIITFVLVFLVGFLPLFGAPGYEQALASGIIAPSAAAITAALVLSTAIPTAHGGAWRMPIDQLIAGVRIGALCAVAAFASSIAHGLRVGFCSFGPAIPHFLLTAGAGAVLGGAWGAVVAELARRVKRRRLVAVLCALAGPIGGVVLSLWRFYTSPMVFAFDPFAGYFAGTLYDTVIDAGSSLATYRLGSLCTLGATLFAASVCARTDAGEIRLRRGSSRLVAAATAAALCAGGSAAITALGPELGHWHTVTTITNALGAVDSGPRCDVVHGDDVPRDVAELMVRDCEEQLAAVEAALGAKGPSRITAFMFRDKNEKKRLMGAADTYIAKPWRKEVYLQSASYPHPVLAHELAHVVAGSFGVGSFKVSGRFGGLVPNPGLIEGVAVAAAPEHDVLSEEEWSRAMLDLGILPSLDSVFSLGFLGESSSKSYTVAGAAVRWLMERNGKEAVRALYAGAPPESVVGGSWPVLDSAFRVHLSSLKLEPAALAYAKARFDRPSVFGRKCPHEVDALVHEAASCRDGSRYDRALVLYQEALRRNSREMPALLGEATTRLRMGEIARARADLDKLAANEQAPRNVRDKAEEALADADVREGKFVEASDRYRAIADRVMDEDNGRTLEVKSLLAADPMARASLEGLLLGTPGHTVDLALGLTRLETWRSATQDPLAEYLVGRNLLGKSSDDALRALRKAVEGPLPTDRIRREAARQLAIAGCMTQDREAWEQAYKAVMLEKEAGAHSGWVADVVRQLDACAPPPK